MKFISYLAMYTTYIHVYISIYQIVLYLSSHFFQIWLKTLTINCVHVCCHRCKNCGVQCDLYWLRLAHLGKWSRNSNRRKRYNVVFDISGFLKVVLTFPILVFPVIGCNPMRKIFMVKLYLKGLWNWPLSDCKYEVIALNVSVISDWC